MRLKIALLVALCVASGAASAQQYRGQISANPYAAPQYHPAPMAQPAQVYNQQGQYRGNINTNQYDPNSVSNPYGQYGSQYSQKSMNNQYGEGSPYSAGSPTNPYGQGWSVYGR